MTRSIIHLSEERQGSKRPTRGNVPDRSSSPVSRERRNRERFHGEEKLSSIPEGMDRRKVLIAVIIVASVLLAGLLTFKLMGVLEDDAPDDRKVLLQDSFNTGSNRVLLNTTFLG
ncbi:MAG: hypothetical protein U9R75_01630, partial [Candidatus Thermoplasmatota archaeon]|nr:hypothetical protein [Candidatus Thermoplasmatota archaeon]